MSWQHGLYFSIILAVIIIGLAVSMADGAKLLVKLFTAMSLFMMGAFMLFCACILTVEAGVLVQVGLMLAGISMIVMSIGTLVRIG